MEALDIEQLAKRDAAKNAQSAAEDAAKIKKRGYDDVVISDVSSTDTMPDGKSDEENNKKVQKGEKQHEGGGDKQHERGGDKQHKGEGDKQHEGRGDKQHESGEDKQNKRGRDKQHEGGRDRSKKKAAEACEAKNRIVVGESPSKEAESRNEKSRDGVKPSEVSSRKEKKDKTDQNKEVQHAAVPKDASDFRGSGAAPSATDAANIPQEQRAEEQKSKRCGCCSIQ